MAWGVLLLTGAMALGAAIGAGIMERTYQADAVRLGYALYCPQNGQFAWKGDCGDTHQ